MTGAMTPTRGPVMPGVTLVMVHESSRGWQMWRSEQTPPQWFVWRGSPAQMLPEAEAKAWIVADKRNHRRRAKRAAALFYQGES